MLNLAAPKRTTSLYESFSDLIFATMAIFVLLMVIFLTMIKASDDALREEMEEKTQALARAQKAEEQLKELVKTVGKLEGLLKTRDLEIVVAVDVTGSMSEEILHLKATIDTIASAWPSIVPTFRMGIIAYGHKSGESPVTVFPMTTIATKEQDQGRSFARLEGFVNQLQANRRRAPVRAALKKSLDLFTPRSQFSGSQVFMLLGDVGPYEMLTGNSTSKQQAENEVYRAIQGWATQSELRKVISLYSVLGESVRYQNQQFFENVAKSAGDNGSYTEQAAKMLAVILKSILDKDS